MDFREILRANGTEDAFNGTYAACAAYAQNQRMSATTPEDFAAAGVRVFRSAQAALAVFTIPTTLADSLAAKLSAIASTAPDEE
jgi:hypothetical protein